MAGVFIVLEGGEGSGKSTQARLLYTRLYQAGRQALMLHEPGGTPLGDQIRRLLIAERGDVQRSRRERRQPAMEPLAELLLFSAARAELVRKVLQPALEAGQTVICDRYTQSTVAYQGYGRGIPLETIHLINQTATGGLSPDLVVLLDLPPEAALRRVRSQMEMLGEREQSSTAPRQDGEGQQRFEQEPLAFHRKVRQGYLEQAKADPERWLVVDGTLSQEALAERIWQRVEPLVRG